MSSITDLFTPDGKVELKITDLKELFRLEAINHAENMCMINGLRAGIPADHILTMIGENIEEEENNNGN